MRTLHALGLGLAVLAGAGAAQAQQEKAQAKGAAQLRETLIQLDANGDMTIEAHEVPESARDAFDRLLQKGDANKDGKLDGAEMRTLLGKLRALGGGPERLKAMDKNGDGQVSREEFTGPMLMFDRLDADKDGAISRAEIEKAPRPEPPRPSPGRPRTAEPRKPEPPKTQAGLMGERLKLMDQNGDGRIARAEFRGRAEMFDRLDRNNDGFIARDELPRAIGARPEARKKAQLGGRRLMAMDRDGDGKISRTEFRGPERLFDRLDANRDGAIRKNELPRDGLPKKKAKGDDPTP